MADGSRIIAGLEEVVAYVEGDKTRGREVVVDIPRQIDVRDIRRRLGMSQSAFAQRFGFSVHTLRNWEQGHRQPEGPSRVLLTLIDRIPDAVQSALREP